MPLLPPTVQFPEADTYVKYWDTELRSYLYLHLVERDMPLRYPRRISSVAPGSKTDLSIFDEIDPSERKHHVYKVYIGCYPGFLYHLWHPYDVKQLQWDERIQDIDEDLAATITYEESPYDAPTKGIWVIHERYPGLEVRNVGRQTYTAKVFLFGAKYRVEYDDELSASIKNDLQGGQIPSSPITIGGEW